jgi:hypothetical protein
LVYKTFQSSLELYLPTNYKSSAQQNDRFHQQKVDLKISHVSGVLLLLLQVRLVVAHHVVLRRDGLLVHVVRGAIHAAGSVLADAEGIRQRVVMRVVVEDGRHLPHRVAGDAVEEVGPVLAPRPELPPALDYIFFQLLSVSTDMHIFISYKCECKDMSS